MEVGSKWWFVRKLRAAAGRGDSGAVESGFLLLSGAGRCAVAAAVSFALNGVTRKLCKLAVSQFSNAEHSGTGIQSSQCRSVFRY